MEKKSKFQELLIIIIGSSLVAFAICTIHSKLPISEGGQLGFELLMHNWFGISPAITSFVFDLCLYTIGYIILGKKFILNAIIGTLSYSIFYFIFEHYQFISFDISNNLLFASIFGGILVGIGCGMVVNKCGACGGDDSLALILNHITKLPISICYFSMDIFILLFSLTYIPIYNIFYSVITSLISSLIIGCFSDYKKRCNNKFSI